MKIKKLCYGDEEYQWKLNSIEFLPNLNLLVGVSGAGKTQILRAINRLKAVANGESLNGVYWDVEFLTENHSLYRWRGKFETKPNHLIVRSDSDEEECRILYEYVERDHQNIVERTQEKGIFFKNQSTPKLSPFKSIIELLSEEEDLNPVQKEFDKIIESESSQSIHPTSILRLPRQILQKYVNCDVQQIKNAELPLLIKLALVYRYLPEIFQQIKSVFIEIFDQVEDIKIEPFQEDELPLEIADFLRESILIKIKEKQIENWIRQDNISSGMFKTLMYISQLYLSPDDCVILIDEFENSLGVNCIDSVIELLLHNPQTQFIITSHHPYIINNVSPVYWKIVTRQGSLVTVKDAADFHISASRQKAFIDLINLLKDDDQDEEE
ncbi:AAA family ATPase [Spirulina subsalsa]|uniref:AAA family ATPase n=1 Tax=Spirulina subsalsa TaxID=54311 RepID=UPI00030179B8|nr:AAA family ATPase [Spirulina subsalsa]